jgi:hypothetical protein
VPSTSGAEEDDDPVRQARAYNNSIYLMVGMPYFLLGVVGYLVYRGRKQQARVQPPLPAGSERAPDGQGELPCPAPSAGEPSSGIRLPPGP